jgi:hypothetical protein
MSETTAELFPLLWKNLEAYCFHHFLTDSPTKQSKNSENSELQESSKTAKTVNKIVLWSHPLYHINTEFPKP